MKPRYFFALLAFSSAAVAQTSEEYALMGAQTCGAWSCSALASHAGNGSKTERLFNLGYGLVRTFLEAVRAVKVTSEDLSKHPQMMFADLLPARPSIEFNLG